MNYSQNIISWYPGVTLEEIEQMVIEKAMVHFNGNKTAAANALGIGVRTIHTKLDLYAEKRLEFEKRKEIAELEEAEFLRKSRGLPSKFDSAETISELPSYKAAVEKRAAEMVAEQSRQGNVMGGMPARNPGPPVADTFKAAAKTK